MPLGCQKFHISVIVPSYRRPGDLARCLCAIAGQTRPADDVVVVLRAEDEASRAVTRTLGVRVVTVAEPGQVAALNAGCRAAHGDVLAITDDDTRPHPGWLAAIGDRLASDPRIGAVGGRDVVHHAGGIDDGVAARVGRVEWWGRLVGNHHLRAPLQDVDFLKGANMAFRRAAWAPFDPRLRGQGAQVANDLEATWSVRRRGWRVVYDPAIVVEHHPAPRHDEDGRAMRTIVAERCGEHNELYAVLRHAPRWQRPIVFAYQLLAGTRSSPGLALGALERSASASRLADLARARAWAVRTLLA